MGERNRSGDGSSESLSKSTEHVDMVLVAPEDTMTINKTPRPTYLRQFTELSTLFPTIVLTTLSIGAYGFYRSYLRRIPAAGHISPSFFRRRSIFGKVTSVGDGDNFRIYHTPGGRLAGWGLWRKVPDDKKELQHQTVHLHAILIH